MKKLLTALLLTGLWLPRLGAQQYALYVYEKSGKIHSADSFEAFGTDSILMKSSNGSCWINIDSVKAVRVLIGGNEETRIADWALEGMKYGAIAGVLVGLFGNIYVNPIVKFAEPLIRLIVAAGGALVFGALGAIGTGIGRAIYEGPKSDQTFNLDIPDKKNKRQKIYDLFQYSQTGNRQYLMYLE